MAPKVEKKKVVGSRRRDESSEPSGSVEEYHISQIRVIAAGETHWVTRGQVHEAAQIVILGIMGVQLLEDSNLT